MSNEHCENTLTQVIVVIGKHLGWDNIIGIYEDEEALINSEANQDSTTPCTSLAEYQEKYKDDEIVMWKYLESTP
tara:strand:+ start:18 stop:242 length:225 start_codon:yes stop_codon:yes gene_type:complete